MGLFIDIISIMHYTYFLTVSGRVAIDFLYFGTSSQKSLRNRANGVFASYQQLFFIIQYLPNE